MQKYAIKNVPYVCLDFPTVPWGMGLMRRSTAYEKIYGIRLLYRVVCKNVDIFPK